MIRQINQVPDASGAGYYNPCSGALSIIMPSEAINLVQNPSFELYKSPYTNGVAFVGWTAARRVGGSTTTVSDISAYITAGNPVWSGANAFYTANTGTTGDFVSLTYFPITVASGQHYAFSFYIYGASGSNRRSYTARVLNGGVVLGQKAFPLIEGQWQRVEVVFLSGVNSNQVGLVIEKSSIAGSWAGGNAYIDAVQFEQVAAPDTDIGIGVSSMHATTYFDGDTEGTIDDSTGVYEYAWEGTPHRSRSVRYATTASGGRIYNLQDEFGLEIIGIAEAGINQPQVQAITYGSQDGGSLQDIINPVRTITFIGQLAGATKTELARKVQRLQALLSRDLYVNRQDRTFIFQHYDDREALGVPMTFRGAFAGGLNVFMADALTVNVDIAVQMHDPYFYGHDEALRMPADVVSNNRIYRVSQLDSATKTRLLEDVATGLNGAVRAIAQAPDGRVWIGGDFTQSLTGQILRYICIWNPATNTFSSVPGAVLNDIVTAIKFDINGLAWIGGAFTTVGIGDRLTTHNGAGYSSTGNFNSNVAGIEIVPIGGGDYEVFAVGGFTTAPSGAANRIARYDSIGGWSSYAGTGFNQPALATAYNPLNDTLYVGGNFTTTNGITTGRVVALGRASGSVTALDAGITLNSIVRSVYVDADGTVVAAGDFYSASIKYLAYYTGTSWAQFPGFTHSTTFGPFSNFNNTIIGYKGGILAGGFPVITTSSQDTFLPSLSYWNGTTLGGSAWVPIASTSIGVYVGYVLPDGTLITATVSSASTGQIVHTQNSSTIQTYPTIRMVFGGVNVQVGAIVNVRDDKLMLFTDRNINTGPTLFDLDFLSRDLIVIKPKAGTIQSAQFGNLIRVLSLAGVFADFTLRPGSVSMAMIVNSLTSADQVDVYWRQAFQSIFDGVNKQ